VESIKHKKSTSVDEDDIFNAPCLLYLFIWRYCLVSIITTERSKKVWRYV